MVSKLALNSQPRSLELSVKAKILSHFGFDLNANWIVTHDARNSNKLIDNLL